MTPEIAISLAIKKEILYDINNGLFSDSTESNSKYYRDKENEFNIEVTTEYNDLTGLWNFDVTTTNDYGEEFILEEGQWLNLNKALMQDIEWRGENAKSEAEHIKYLWNCA